MLTVFGETLPEENQTQQRENQAHSHVVADQQGGEFKTNGSLFSTEENKKPFRLNSIHMYHPIQKHHV